MRRNAGSCSGIKLVYKGVVKVSNEPSRMVELEEFLSGIMKSGKVRPVDQTEMCAECVAKQLWRSDLTPCLRDIAKKRRRKRWSSS